MRESIIHGLLRATRSWQMLGVMLVASGLAAIAPATPAFTLVRLSTLRSLFAARMLADKADIIWLADYVNHRLPAVPSSDASVTILLGLAAMLLTWALQIFWSGGILYCYRDELSRFSMGEFFRGAILYYWRFFKLAVIAAVAYGAVVLAFVIIYGVVSLALSGSEESPGIMWEWLILLLALFTAFVVSVVLDYVRISTVVSQSRKIIPEIGRGALFFAKNLTRCLGIALAVSVIGLVCFALAHWLRASIVQSTETRVWVGAIIGQLAIALLIWKRLALFAAEMDFFYRRKPVALPHEPLPQPSSTEIPEEPAELLYVE